MFTEDGVRVSTYILIKKILFLLTILRLGDENVFEQVFISRLNTFLKDKDRCTVNKYRSPIFDILSACVKFGQLSKLSICLFIKSVLQARMRGQLWSGQRHGNWMMHTGE